jgi:putative FmdB family regulatory protein
MPTYEFKCQACGRKFERFLKITDDGDLPCPTCGGDSKRMISSGGGLLFKGSGFYATDYRKPDYKRDIEKDT